MADDEAVDITVRLKEAARFQREAKTRVAEPLDEIGDKASYAARQLGQLNRQAVATRINLGPMSFQARTGILAFGALAVTTRNLAGGILSLGEAAVTVGAGGAAAGGAGLVALAQGAGVATLGLRGLQDALGGNEEALKRLSPRARELFDILEQVQTRLAGNARRGMLPGMLAGAQAARRNMPVVNQVTRRTGRVLGGIAGRGGEMVGSEAWGRDIQTVGNRNARILGNLGDAALHGADGLRHLIVEAGPLTEWLSQVAEQGALSARSFLAAKRQTGELAAFFREARTDLELLASAGGHGTRGILNLFGAQDVDGTRTLRNFDQILARFERWSNSPAVRNGVGEAIIAEIPDLADDLAVALARLLGEAAPTAAGIFWDSFWQASAEGKAVMGAALLWKTGAFKMLGGAVGQSLGLGGGIPTVGVGRSRAVPVLVVNPGGAGLPVDGPGGGRGRGGSRIPPWLGGAKGIAGRLGLLGAAAWGANELAQATAKNDFPTKGLDHAIREEQGRPSRGGQQDALRRPAPRGFLDKLGEIHLHTHLDGREIHKSVVRVEAEEHARRGGGAPQGMQTIK